MTWIIVAFAGFAFFVIIVIVAIVAGIYNGLVRGRNETRTGGRRSTCSSSAGTT
jgi:uncharacterized membrane protein